MESEKLFLVKDLSGRGYVTKMDVVDTIDYAKYLLNVDDVEDEEDEEYIDVFDWINYCSVGDSEYIGNATKVTRIN